MGTDPKHLLGTTLSGRYRIEKAIGEGGMGAIFQATQLSLGRAVAIKVVKCVHGESSDAVRRFELETEVIARLAHPNIVQVVDAGKADDGTMYLAMELLDGDSVRQLLRKAGTVPVARALAIVEDVASALSAAHAGGVIHRDLKAENVMLVKAAGKQEIAKVLDFGVAKLTTKTEAPPQTGSGFVAGTPGCIAPEQMLGKSDEPRSDLYSVGVLMFEMLAGEAPFVASSSVELMLRHLTEPAPRVADVARARGRPDVPGPVDELVASLLSKDPEARPRSAEALVEIVASLRDASRATQPDLRLPTPMGGFAVPTPGSVSLPTPQSAALVTPGAGADKPITAPTTNVPVPAAAAAAAQAIRPAPSRKVIALRIAGVVALTATVVIVGSRVSAHFGDRAIPGWFGVGEAWQAFDQLDEAYLALDTRKVKALAEQVKAKHEVPMAWLYLAQAASLERAPLTEVDRYYGEALASADRRAPMTGRTHTQRLAATLAEIDPQEATRKWIDHLENHGCQYPEVERHMFAVKMTFTDVNGERMAETYRRILGQPERGYSQGQLDVAQLPPIGQLGVARALRHQQRYQESLAILRPLYEAHPKNPVILDALVDNELGLANAAGAVALLEDYLASSEDLRATLRLASIKGRTDKDAFEPLLARIRTLVQKNPAKAEALSMICYLYASRGRLVEAEGLCNEALAAVGEDDTRAAEIAVFASMLGAIGGDVDFARRFLQIYQDHSLGLAAQSVSSRRLQAFALGDRILIAGVAGTSMSDPAVVLDHRRLMDKRTDVPLLADTVQWHALMGQDDIEGALAVAEKLPLCFRDAHIGLVREKNNDLAGAAESFAAASSPNLEAYCTSGDDVVPFIQSMQFAKSLALRAYVAMKRGDVDEVEASLRRYYEFWPFRSIAKDATVVPWRQQLDETEAWAAKPR